MKWNFETLEKHRLRQGNYETKSGETFGAFLVPFGSFDLRILATDGKGFYPEWEHVSVSLSNRTPNWKEMCFLKDLFWGEDEIVIQFHPPKLMYVNDHPNCLHLWKPQIKIELPPSIYVGKTVKNISSQPTPEP